MRGPAAAGVLLALLTVLPAVLGEEGLTTIRASGHQSSAGHDMLLPASADAAAPRFRGMRRLSSVESLDTESWRRSLATGNLSSSTERACPGGAVHVAWSFDPGRDVALQLWLAGPGDGATGLGSIVGTAFLAQVFFPFPTDQTCQKSIRMGISSS